MFMTPLKLFEMDNDILMQRERKKRTQNKVKLYVNLYLFFKYDK